MNRITINDFYLRFQTSLGAVILLLLVTFIGCASEPVFKPKKLLVVTLTKGFKHESIPTAEKVIAEIGNLNQSFIVEYARTDRLRVDYNSDAHIGESSCR